MERRYESRLEEMLEDAEVSPEMLEGMLTRLETFVEPFAEALDEPAQRRQALTYMTGLLSDLKHKTGEEIAFLHDQQRQGIQKFIGHVPWDHQPLLATLADPSRRAVGGTRRGHRVRSRGLRQEGGEVRGRGVAVVRPAREGRQLP